MAMPSAHSAPPSPLMLADRLLTMAQETDRAGFTDVAERLLTLMHDVLDRPSRH